VRQDDAHHWPAKHQPCRSAADAGKAQQVDHRCADRRQQVARPRQGATIQRHDALDQRFAAAQGTMHGGAGGHIVHQHTDLGGARVGRHFLAGQRLDQLLVRSHRIARRHRSHLHVAESGRGHPHGGDCLWLVVFNANQGLTGADGVHHDAQAIDHFGGAIAHDPIVG
jgi:hypothetical protein